MCVFFNIVNTYNIYLSKALKKKSPVFPIPTLRIICDGRLTAMASSKNLNT